MSNAFLVIALLGAVEGLVAPEREPHDRLSAVVDLLRTPLVVRALDSLVVLHDVHAYMRTSHGQPGPALPATTLSRS